MFSSVGRVRSERSRSVRSFFFSRLNLVLNELLLTSLRSIPSKQLSDSASQRKRSFDLKRWELKERRSFRFFSFLSHPPLNPRLLSRHHLTLLLRSTLFYIHPGASGSTVEGAS